VFFDSFRCQSTAVASALFDDPTLALLPTPIAIVIAIAITATVITTVIATATVVTPPLFQRSFRKSTFGVVVRSIVTPFNPIFTGPYRAMPFCDPTKTLEERAADMVSRMTLDEKVKSLDNGAPPVVGLGTHSYNWWSEASTGVANEVERRGQGTPTTKFAFPITTGRRLVITFFRFP
jgi:hypothetical protein